MIYTVTLNPAFDKTITCENFEMNSLNRVIDSREDIGGKGINVSKIIKVLGGESVACGLLAEKRAAEYLNELDSMGISHHFISLPEQTIRTNSKIINQKDASFTEINEPGPYVSLEDIKKLTDYISQKLLAEDIVVLSGSLPQGLSYNTYGKLIKKFKEKTKYVFLDIAGKALLEGIKEAPYLIKPNLLELEEIQDKKLQTRAEIKEAAHHILNQGIENILVSLDSKGSIFFSKDVTYRIHPISVRVKSPVGAGDSQVGAFAYGLTEGLTTLEILTLASAVSTAMVTTSGTDIPDAKTIQKFINQAKLESI